MRYRKFVILALIAFAACAKISVVSPDGQSSASYNGTSIVGSEDVSCGQMAGVTTCSVSAEARAHQIEPKPGETWDQFVARVPRAMFTYLIDRISAIEIAMFWHVGHLVTLADSTWDAKYAAQFDAALLNAQEELGG